MNLKFYAEYAYYKNSEEKEEAKIYLTLWKKFYLRKLGKQVEYVNEQWVDREDLGTLAQYSSLALKFCVKDEKNNVYELDGMDQR